MQMIEYNQNLEISGPFEITNIEQRRQKNLNTIEDQTRKSTEVMMTQPQNSEEDKEIKLFRQKSQLQMHRKTSSMDKLPSYKVKKQNYIVQ